MTRARLFRFKFTAPLHIANVRADYDRSETTLSSDTLYAAVMSAWATLGMADWISPEPAFALSSLFPYYKQGTQMRYFLPKPASALKTKDQSAYKQIKKARYVEAELFAQWAKGNPIEPDTKHLAGDFYLKKPADDKEKDIIKNFMASEVYPRVRVPRVERYDAEPYYIERIWFAEGCGLYCLFIGSDEDYRKVKTALNFLQHEGIGTDRHVGNGLFELEEENALPESFNFKLDSATHLVNLSLFCPESREQLESLLPEKDSRIAYELVKRGGWVTAEPFLTLRKKYVYMFREGSVFARPRTDFAAEVGFALAGKTHNVRPDWNDEKLHPVYRSGRAIFVPVKMN